MTVQFSLKDNKLIRVQREEAGPVCIDALDIDTGVGYSYQAESASTEIIDGLIHPEEAGRLSAAAMDDTLIFTYTRVLPSGLELRPQKLVLERSQKPLSLVDMIGELCRTNATLAASLSQVKEENARRSRYLQDMVEEKEKYQHTMLQRVCAVLDERNARNAAGFPEIKEELN